MEQNDDPAYQAQLFAHWELLQRLAQNRFKGSALADQALDFVLEKLQQDHWSRLRAYRGGASFKTYLAHVVRRLLEDFARHRFGRQRIPDWIQAQGSLWEQVYRLLCLERMSAIDVIETLRDAVPGGRPPQIIREAIAVIRKRVVNCGAPSSATAEQPLVEQEEHRYRPLADDVQAHQLSPEALQAAEERTQLLTLLYGSVLDSAADSSPPAAWRQAAQRLRAVLSLSPEERLLLRLIYQDGLSVVEAGRLLGLRTDQVHGRLRRLLQRIRQAMEASGLAQELKELLQGEHDV